MVPGAVIPPLSMTLVLLAILAPRAMAGSLLVYTICLLCSLRPLLASVTINWRALAFPLVAFGWFALSTVWGDSPRRFEMLRDAAYVLACTATLFTTLPVWSADLRRRTLDWVLTAAAIGTLGFVVQFMFGFPLTRAINHLPSDADLLDTNMPKRIACALGLLLWPCALCLWRRGQYLLAQALIFMVIALLLALSSRAAMVGGLAALVVFYLTRLDRRMGQGIGLLLLPLGIPLALLAAHLLPDYIDPQALVASGEARLEIWQATLTHILETWRLGIGLDGSRTIDPIIQDHPHNAYLQVMLEGGIVGAALVTLLAATLWQRLRRAGPLLQPFIWAYLAAAAGILAIAYGLWQGWWLALFGWTAFLLMLAAKEQTDE